MSARREPSPYRYVFILVKDTAGLNTLFKAMWEAKSPREHPRSGSAGDSECCWYWLSCWLRPKDSNHAVAPGSRLRRKIERCPHNFRKLLSVASVRNCTCQQYNRRVSERDGSKSILTGTSSVFCDKNRSQSDRRSDSHPPLIVGSTERAAEALWFRHYDRVREVHQPLQV